MKRTTLVAVLVLAVSFVFCFSAQAQSIVVKKYDSFWKIAKHHRISFSELKKLNRHKLVQAGNFNLIKPGQVFELPIKIKKTKVSSYAADIRRIRQTKASGANYVSVKGDTLSKLAVGWYGSSRYVKNIAKENNILDPRKVPTGKILKFPNVETIDMANYKMFSYVASRKNGNKEISAGIRQTFYSPEIRQRMKSAINEGAPVVVTLKKGGYADYAQDASGVISNSPGGRFSWKNIEKAELMIWDDILAAGYCCAVSAIDRCGNFKVYAGKSSREEPPKVQLQATFQPMPQPSLEVQVAPIVQSMQAVLQLEILPPQLTTKELSVVAQSASSEKKKENPYVGCEDLPKTIVIMEKPVYATMNITRMTCEERRNLLKEIAEGKGTSNSAP